MVLTATAGAPTTLSVTPRLLARRSSDRPSEATATLNAGEVWIMPARLASTVPNTGGFDAVAIPTHAPKEPLTVSVWVCPALTPDRVARTACRATASAIKAGVEFGSRQSSSTPSPLAITTRSTRAALAANASSLASSAAVWPSRPRTSTVVEPSLRR